MQADAVVIGAGLAGAAVAYQLARRGVRNVVILEQESTPGFHSSSRNASMIRQVVPDARMSRIATQGARFLASARDEWGLPDLVRQSGSLLLAGDARGGALRRDVDDARGHDLEVELIDRRAAEARVPEACGGEFDVVAWTPSDGVVDTHALLQGLLRGARRGGGELVVSSRVDAISVDGAGSVRSVRAGALEIATPCVVNAAGAWAPEVARLAGALDFFFND